MKKTKIIISFALCFALILCLSITAFADSAELNGKNFAMANTSDYYDLHYGGLHHYVPYDTVVGRYVFNPVLGDTTPKSTYVTYAQSGLFDYAEYFQYSSMNPCANGNTIDGIFGQQTESCVRSFQSHCGLSPDGIVGNDTWGKLESCLRVINIVYS